MLKIDHARYWIVWTTSRRCKDKKQCAQEWAVQGMAPSESNLHMKLAENQARVWMILKTNYISVHIPIRLWQGKGKSKKCKGLHLDTGTQEIKINSWIQNQFLSCLWLQLNFFHAWIEQVSQHALGGSLHANLPNRVNRTEPELDPKRWPHRLVSGLCVA